MQAINAVFDGNFFKPLEPIPVEGKYELEIIDRDEYICTTVINT
jgi:hypothetical protein